MKELDPFKALDLVPQPLTIITAGDPDTPGKRGGMTAAWVSRVSWNPPLIAVSMTTERYTYKLIKEFKSFAVHVISKKYEEAAFNIFGSLSGRNIDKFDKAGIKPAKARSIIAPIIPDVPIILECKLVTEYPAGDHVIIIGEVLKGYRGSEEPPLILISFRCCEVK